MKALHHTRVLEYRTPFGALPLGESVSLALDIWGMPEGSARCRLWIDGQGETWIPMEREQEGERLRFSCTLTPEKADLVWYSFLMTDGQGRQYRYGARQGAVGGEGALYEGEPPSFQLTVFRPRVVPSWYKGGLAYQIFPDRFARGEDWEQRVQAAMGPRRGPERILRENWEEQPGYGKDEAGRVTRWEFSGGTLAGIREKLPYLQNLGVTVLYLNPIFEAASCHRYDTGDYRNIDPMLGDEREFQALCQAGKQRGISILLDGVFNHTGCDSRYFNKYGNYPEEGAFQGEGSPYRSWYHFTETGYTGWWGVEDLPNVEESDPSYRKFICERGEGVVPRWIRAGAQGWRLDVADELPDAFIQEIKEALLAENPHGVLLGEVWEDASNKISYGKLRRYLLGEELDAVMNYPLRAGLAGYILGQQGAEELAETLRSLQENYPPEAFYSGFNLMGSHDRPRLLTVLGEAPPEETLTPEQQREFRLSEGQRSLAKGRLWLVTLCQMTLPGVPCIYYGDEAGMEGYSDPWNRGTYPWGNEDPDTGAIYRNAIALRRLFPLLTTGTFVPLSLGPEVFGFRREEGEEGMTVLVNRSVGSACGVTVPLKGVCVTELIRGQRVSAAGGEVSLTLPPMGSAVLWEHPRLRWGKPLPRGSGILCHITSLPKGEGPGTLGQPAREFVDFLAATGQTYWQILPVNPTDAYGSPYAGVSAFAGNPQLLDTGGKSLEETFGAFSPDEAYETFCRENEGWLTPYALFMTLRDQLGGAQWQKWPEEYRQYSPALAKEPELARGMAYHQFTQYLFSLQWGQLRAYAKEKGILILGDMPMYVSEHSADVWAEREQFCLDEEGSPAQVAGVPPDYFAQEGQLWGNPLYDWKRMAESGYDWWLRRLERAFSLYDYVRLDHFRGFEAYWAVPRGEKAAAGQWQTGPGCALFQVAYEKFGPLPVVAEDLGSITPGVRGLVARCGFPGMDVLQFYDGDPKIAYQPPEDKVVYSGTHDNQTLVGWCKEQDPEEDPATAAAALLETVMTSCADVVILPLQDVLGLDDAARMNVPGVAEGNWSWQAERDSLSGAAARLEKLTRQSERSRGTCGNGIRKPSMTPGRPV